MSSERQVTVQEVLSKKRREIFLKVLARTGRTLEAARAAGYKDTNYLNHVRAADEEFAMQWEAAIYASADLLEEAAHTRAVDGVMKPVFFKGEVVGHEVNYSDALLIELLRARRPKDFRKANQEVNVDVNVKANIGVAILPMIAPNADTWEADAARLQEQQKRLPAFADNVIDGKATVIPEAESSPVVRPESKPKPEDKKGSFNQEIGRG